MKNFLFLLPSFPFIFIIILIYIYISVNAKINLYNCFANTPNFKLIILTYILGREGDIIKRQLFSPCIQFFDHIEKANVISLFCCCCDYFSFEYLQNYPQKRKQHIFLDCKQGSSCNSYL
jgi:hypothetical protein